MMRCSVHIDAGYLYSALATRTTGSANRAAINVEVEPLIRSVGELAVADSGMRLLRLLWYDAAKEGVPDASQRRIGLIDSVKLRMGRINYYGEQKGVDLRLGLDLVSLAANRAAEVAYLISGDDDLTEAVSDAQELGLQVKLIAVPGAMDGRGLHVAANLSLAVDGVMTIPVDTIERTVSRTTRRPAAVVAPAPVPGNGAGPRVPSPADLFAHRPAAPPPPGAALAEPSAVPPESFALSRDADGAVPVYTSETGSPSSFRDLRLLDGVIDEVAESVYRVWSSSASADEVARLLGGRPNIPPQLDRILLLDLVTRSGLDDIPTRERFALRAAFWAATETAATETAGSE